MVKGRLVGNLLTIGQYVPRIPGEELDGQICILEYADGQDHT